MIVSLALIVSLAWLCVFGGLCVDMWRLVHQPMVIFAVLTVFWLIVTCLPWYTVPIVKQSKPLVYQSSQVYQDCTNSVVVYQSSKTVKNSQKTVKTATMTIGVPIVTCLPRLYEQCTNRQKQSKQQKLPLVYQSSHVYTESAEYTKSASASAVRIRVHRIHKAT